MLPRTLGVALVVGFLAFLAGVQATPPHVIAPAVTDATPNPSMSPSTLTPTPTIPAGPALPTTMSRFATQFDTFKLMQRAGLFACYGGADGSDVGGRASWIVAGRCSVEAARQPALILKLEREISTAVREGASSRDSGIGGFGGPGDPESPVVMSWDYHSDGVEYGSGGADGSIYLVVTHAGSDLQVIIVLSEWAAA